MINLGSLKALEHGALLYVGSFLLILTVLVFVHEFGHYLIARWNRVRVEVFSIGFGPELFGRQDRAGTRWKFSAIPLGGYVKMLGDSDPASMLPAPRPSSQDGAGQDGAGDREGAFNCKNLGQRAAIVAAGPAANFLFAMIVLAVLFMTFGEPQTPPIVGQVQSDSAAQQGGIRPGDVIVSIDGQRVRRFEDVQQAVRFDPGKQMTIILRRGGADVTVHVTPKRTELTDRFGNRFAVGLLGITHSGMDYVKLAPVAALTQAGSETWGLSVATLKGLWQILIGMRSTDELGGPLRIAQMSGEVAQQGPVAILWLLAVLSINLGLINLFPVPVLDGGHLLFYAAEAVRGKPLGPRAQEYGFRIGLALVLTLMVFATRNDLVHLGIWSWLKGLVT
jgi:regulator of sigma E protease